MSPAIARRLAPTARSAREETIGHTSGDQTAALSAPERDTDGYSRRNDSREGELVHWLDAAMGDTHGSVCLRAAWAYDVRRLRC